MHKPPKSLRGVTIVETAVALSVVAVTSCGTVAATNNVQANRQCWNQ